MLNLQKVKMNSVVNQPVTVQKSKQSSIKTLLFFPQAKLLWEKPREE